MINNDLRRKFIKSSKPNTLKHYFDTLHGLVLKDESYRKIYLEDYNYYKNTQSGGFLTNKKYDCNKIKTKFNDNFLTTLPTPLTKSDTVKFIDFCICYINENNLKGHFDDILRIVKEIKKSNDLLTHAINHLNKIKMHTNLLNKHFQDMNNKLINAKDPKTLSDTLKHIKTDIEKKEHGMNPISMFKTAFIMAFYMKQRKNNEAIMKFTDKQLDLTALDKVFTSSHLKTFTEREKLCKD